MGDIGKASSKTALQTFMPGLIMMFYANQILMTGNTSGKPPSTDHKRWPVKSN